MTAPLPARTGRLVVVSTYPPRRCGLATFTRDLRAALGVAAPGWRVDVAALDRTGLRYGPEVLTAIRQDEPADYRRAAELIAAAGTDLVVIQHEYGIFGGADGRYLLDLVAELRRRGVPYAATLHTVLSAPTAGQADVLRTLCAGAAVVSVFTPGAQRVLADSGLAPDTPVGVVPHGAPVVLRERGRAVPDTSRVRAVLPGPGPEPAPVLTTFGLIGPGKGLEQVISALPAIARRHPGVRYVIAGATHPEVLRKAGECYREGLVALARRLGVAARVRFLDAFLTDVELAELLAHTTVYLTPYRGTEQACSGTLAFALVAGCPVVSTPYRYAQELLVPAAGTAPGVLVARDDRDALAAAVTGLLDEPDRRRAAADAAYAMGAGLTWPSVGARCAELYTAAVPALGATRDRYPQRLDHLSRLTDGTGIIQFARGPRPDRGSGYCVDDVARLALVAAGVLGERPGPAGTGDPRAAAWLRTSLSFLDAAVAGAGMHNLLAPDGNWLDRPHLGDHVGRALWAAGVLAARPGTGGGAAEAARLLRRLLPLAGRLVSVRSVAYAALGLAAGVGTVPEAEPALRVAAQRLDGARYADRDWQWFEPLLTYDNARLPQALLAAGTRLDDPRLTERALSTLDWYLAQAGLGGAEPEMLRCVDNRWRGPADHTDRLRLCSPGEASGVLASATDRLRLCSPGDEQPLDAAATAEALAAAWLATGEPRYARLARLALAWFHGVNRAGIALADPATGACHDGLSAGAANANQGAESTLAYHQALLALRDAGLIDSAVVPPAHGTGWAGRRQVPAGKAAPRSPRSSPHRRRATRIQTRQGGINPA